MSSLRGFLISAGIIAAAILLIKLITFAVLLLLTAVLFAFIIALGFGLLYSLYVFTRSAKSRCHVH